MAKVTGIWRALRKEMKGGACQHRHLTRRAFSCNKRAKLLVQSVSATGTDNTSMSIRCLLYANVCHVFHPNPVFTAAYSSAAHHNEVKNYLIRRSPTWLFWRSNQSDLINQLPRAHHHAMPRPSK